MVKMDFNDSFSEILKEELKKHGRENDADKILKDLQKGELEALKDAIDDINDLIEKRKNLHSELIKAINKIITDTSNVITSMPRGITSEETIRTQLELRKKLVDIEEVRLQENLNEWRDIAELKKELRERMIEYQEKSKRGDIIDELIGEK